jgi:transposase-like protein
MANLIDVAKEFRTDEDCLAYLTKLRWPGGVACLKCGSDHVSRAFGAKGRRGTARRQLFQCLEPACKHQFTATTGTLFHDSHLPLTKWFAAVAIITNAKKSVSAKQMERDLGVSYRTAWYLNHRIRKAMEETGGAGLMSGIVEVDETYIGGRYDKRRHRDRNQKQPVMGFIQRGKGGEPSQVRAFPIQGVGKTTLDGKVRAHVSPDATMVCTDSNPGYGSLGRGGFRHHAVNHIALEWVRPSQIGLVHTNSIENFWSLFKRGLVGSFHKVSVKHLHRYLGEFEYRFNGRRHDLFQPVLANLVGRAKMPYRKLVVNEPAS